MVSPFHLEEVITLLFQVVYVPPRRAGPPLRGGYRPVGPVGPGPKGQVSTGGIITSDNTNTTASGIYITSSVNTGISINITDIDINNINIDINNIIVNDIVINNINVIDININDDNIDNINIGVNIGCNIINTNIITTNSINIIIFNISTTSSSSAAAGPWARRAQV